MATIKVLVEGGKASAGAPLGPALGPLGVNVGEVVAAINKETAAFEGMKVPVAVHVENRRFTVEVGSPPMSALILKEAGAEKGAANPKEETAASITLEQAVKIAQDKAPALSSYALKSQVCEVLGTCDSMGVRVNGKRAREAIAEIRRGLHDALLEKA